MPEEKRSKFSPAPGILHFSGGLFSSRPTYIVAKDISRISASTSEGRFRALIYVFGQEIISSIRESDYDELIKTWLEERLNP